MKYIDIRDKKQYDRSGPYRLSSEELRRTTKHFVGKIYCGDSIHIKDSKGVSVGNVYELNVERKKEFCLLFNEHNGVKIKVDSGDYRALKDFKWFNITESVGNLYISNGIIGENEGLVVEYEMERFIANKITEIDLIENSDNSKEFMEALSDL